MKAPKNFFIIFLIAFVSGKFYSQSGKFISFEAGAVFNTMLSQRASLEECNKHHVYDYEVSGCLAYTVQPYFVKQENYNDILIKYGQDYKFYNTIGSYFKTSFEKNVFTYGSFCLSFPVSLSYMNQINNYEKINWSEGAGMNYYAEQRYEISNKMLGLSIGASVNYYFRNLNIYGGLNYYSNLHQSSNIKYAYFDGLNTVETSNNVAWPRLYTRFRGAYISSNLGVNYSISKSISVGPNLEVFFANSVKGLFWNSNLQYQFTGYMLGLVGKNAWINPGLMLKFSF